MRVSHTEIKNKHFVFVTKLNDFFNFLYSSNLHLVLKMTNILQYLEKGINSRDAFSATINTLY